MHVIDLSVPIAHGDGRLGLQVEFDTPYTFEKCGWAGSTFKMFCHYGSHVDAPNHFLEGANGIDLAPLTNLMGPAAVVPLTDHGIDAGITADTLEDRGRHVRPGDIAILQTGWSSAASRRWFTISPRNISCGNQVFAARIVRSTTRF